MLKDEMKARMLAAMKAGRTVEKGILRVALGEVQTLEARTGEAAADPVVEKILRKLIKSNDESAANTSDEDKRTVLGEESAVLASLLPQTLTAEQIVEALAPVREALLAASGDGPATGLAMKHLKAAGATVEGKDVSAAVRTLRA